MVVGDVKHVPPVREVLELLSRPETNVVVNMLGLEVQDRLGFFSGLLPQIAELRARTARPHWILIDEAHHMLPASNDIATVTLPKALPAAIYVTVHPDRCRGKRSRGCRHRFLRRRQRGCAAVA